MVVDTAVQESKVKAILADIKEYRLENIIMEVMRKEERLTRMETRRKTWETKYICREILEDIIRSVRSELEDIVRIVLDEMMNSVLQGNI